MTYILEPARIFARPVSSRMRGSTLAQRSERLAVNRRQAIIRWPTAHTALAVHGRVLLDPRIREDTAR